MTDAFVTPRPSENETPLEGGTREVLAAATYSGGDDLVFALDAISALPHVAVRVFDFSS